MTNKYLHDPTSTFQLEKTANSGVIDFQGMDLKPPSDMKQAKKRRILKKIETLVHENCELLEKNRILEERLSLLAEATGACPHCWGEDHGCDLCQGDGVPGRYFPNRDVFSDYILPAVKVLSRYDQKTKVTNAEKAP
jgi:hypothetical protein